MIKYWLCSLFPFLFATVLFSQNTVSVHITDTKGKGIIGAEVFITPENQLFKTNKVGRLTASLPFGLNHFTVYKPGFENIKQEILIQRDTTISFSLAKLERDLEVVEIKEESDAAFGMTTMNSIDGMAIYAGKKNEVLLPDQINANKAINSARQVYARIPGLNIWESDGAGIQLGIGVRGLSPNRTANINVRQNGYDISADALGYPESYYTPPLEAVERVEYVRGAASLQYGTQFGGMLNFALKEGHEKKPFEFNTRQTIGSYGLFNSFNSIGGSKGRSQYYAFYQYKRGDGWRDNSGFDVHTFYARYGFDINENWNIAADFTHMSYLAQQAGGLTDDQFDSDPIQSNRNRNWFQVNWNLASIKLRGKLSTNSDVDVRLFGLKAGRDALGYLGTPNRLDDETSNRDLIRGEFENFGAEARYLHRYEILSKSSILLVGARAYKGNTLSQQGSANSSNDPDFEYLNPKFSDKSEYDFDNINFALFAEQVVYVNENFTITPGIRYEYIDTRADGYYMNYSTNTVGDTLETTRTDENRARSRNNVLGGVGLSFKPNKSTEIYGNISQNYRAINYGDIRIDNPSLRINPNIQDERGFNADLGLRGGNKKFRYDVGVYFLAYKDRIGSIQMRDTLTFQFYRYRSNIADSRAYGLELYGEWSPFIVDKDHNWGLAMFGNIALTEANYISELDQSIDGNTVELTPELTARTGVRGQFKDFSITWQLSHVSEQYTDATNAEFTPNSVNGLVPAYTVMDVSMKYTIGKFEFSGGVNNLANTAYFTRRADGYPGPGIIPSDGIGGYLTVGATF